jgi:acetyltransferase
MTNALGTAEAIVRIAQTSPKPILCCFMGIIDVSAGVKYLQENGYPVYKFPENAAKSMAALYRFSRWVNREEVPSLALSHDRQRAEEIIRGCLRAGKTHLGELEGTQILACYGFNVLPTTLARSDHEAADIADGIGYPVAMKIVSPQILHKSDAGGVVVGVKSRDEALRQYNAIIERAKRYAPDAELQGVLIQKMAPPGEEVIIGANRYAIGPLIMFGIGGIFVEIFRDVAFRMAPLTREDASLMVREIKGYRLLTGFRGRPPRDIGTIERMIVSLSDMIVNHPEISEMDINPLIVHEDGRGATAADCRMILGSPSDGRRP